MEYLIGLIVALFGVIGYLFTKKNSAEALLQNSDLNKKLNGQDKQITQDEALNAIQEQHRKQVMENLANLKKETNGQTLDELNNFFNTPK